MIKIIQSRWAEASERKQKGIKMRWFEPLTSKKLEKNKL